MNILDLEKMAESSSAHEIRFGGCGLGSLRTPPTEEQLYEIELARLAARQVAQSLPFRKIAGDQRAFEIFKYLTRELGEYKGVSLPSSSGHNYAVVVRPIY